jgi:hypothetical protein
MIFAQIRPSFSHSLGRYSLFAVRCRAQVRGRRGKLDVDAAAGRRSRGPCDCASEWFGVGHGDRVPKIKSVAIRRYGHTAISMVKEADGYEL